MKEQTKFLTEHCEFNNPCDCYVLLAVSRKKDTPEITNSQEIVFRDVIKKEEDIIKKYNTMSAQIKNYKDENDKSYPFYLYVSLNARDAKKATFLLMKKILHWIEEEGKGVDNSKMFKKLYGHFYSTLMTKECKTSSQKYFMIDYDSKKGVIEFSDKLEKFAEVIEGHVTRNGYHIKTKPFDRRKLEELKKEYPVEVKTDANIFVEYIENGEK